MKTSFEGQAPGPLLIELLEAQRRDEAVVAYPAIERVADALIAHARGLDAIVWPVGEAAERVVGAATLLGEGDLAIATWNSRLDGECVVVFAVSGVTPMSLVAAAKQVRSMGAAEVHACGVAVAGAGNSSEWDSFATLVVRDRRPTVSQSA